MHPKFFGDSFDLVKRFFCQELQSIGYNVRIDPMFTGDWNGTEKEFLKLLGVSSPKKNSGTHGKTALFIDPDTGINARGGKQHVSFQVLAEQAETADLVFSFDQSFSRQANPSEVISQKLGAIKKFNCHGFYYDSHARFLFVSKNATSLQEFANHLVSLGLPRTRIIQNDT